MKLWQAGAVLAGFLSAANATGITVSPVPLQPYTQYSFTITATGLDTIIIGLQDDPHYDFMDSVSVTGSAGTNLLTNGSFETGDFTGWSQQGAFIFTWTAYGTANAHDGIYSVGFGAVGTPDFIYQQFTDTPGETLTYSAWVKGSGGTPTVFCMMDQWRSTSCAAAPPSAPEPLTISLFGAALVGWGLRRRARRAAG